MNHKRSRATARKEGKRIDTKRARAAQDQVLRGGHARIIRYWWGPVPQQPLLEESMRRKKMSKKKRAKKKRFQGCPGRPRKAHQFMYDTAMITVIDHYNWYDGHTYKDIEVPYRLCAHCSLEQVKRYGRWTRKSHCA